MMFTTDGLLGEWLDLFRGEEGAPVLDLRGAEFPIGAGRLRVFGKVLIPVRSGGRRERSR